VHASSLKKVVTCLSFNMAVHCLLSKFDSLLILFKHLDLRVVIIIIFERLLDARALSDEFFEHSLSLLMRQGELRHRNIGFYVL
jgi:hypothetical protein